MDRRGKYPPLFTDTEANNCFSIYNTSLTTNSQIGALFSDKMGLASSFFLRMPPGGEYHLISRDWNPIKSREKHYSLVLYILKYHTVLFLTYFVALHLSLSCWYICLAVHCCFVLDTPTSHHLQYWFGFTILMDHTVLRLWKTYILYLHSKTVQHMNKTCLSSWPASRTRKTA